MAHGSNGTAGRSIDLVWSLILGIVNFRDVVVGLGTHFTTSHTIRIYLMRVWSTRVAHGLATRDGPGEGPGEGPGGVGITVSIVTCAVRHCREKDSWKQEELTA